MSKIYTCEYGYKEPDEFGYISYWSIVVAASDAESARLYVKELIGFDSDPVWLMNAEYPGHLLLTSPAGVRGRILYNSNFHYKVK